jgi:hypothetical protein
MEDMKLIREKAISEISGVKPGEGYPNWTTHKCLVRKVMDEPMYKRLSTLKTSKGFTLD